MAGPAHGSVLELEGLGIGTARCDAMRSGSMYATRDRVGDDPLADCATICIMGTMRTHGERVPVDSAEDWAAWLERNHTRHQGVWLVTWRARSGQPVLTYEDSVIEALRFGWIDSSGGRVDDDRTELWFAPRKPGSGWARTNKRRIERLEQEGRMEAAGRHVIDAAKADGSWTLLDDVEDLVVPDRLSAAFDANPGSRAQWDGFPPSARRAILGWIVQAKRPETRARRIEETAQLAQDGKRANEWIPRDQRDAA